MLSRVANAIYWMNRYIERTENYARFLDVNFNLSLDLPPNINEQWKPLVVASGDWNLYESLYKKVDKRSVIKFMGFESRNPNSILSCISTARENARSVRSEITKEVWEEINALYYFVIEGSEKKLWQKKDPRSFFIDVKKSCQLIYGIFDATISRTDGWHFGNMGKLLERADKTSRFLDVKYHILLPSPSDVGSPIDLVQWAALLKSVSAFDMYRKKTGKLSARGITEFLIFDKNFPRAMLRCLILAGKSLDTVIKTDSDKLSQSQKKLGLLKAQLEYADINDINFQGMHEFLDDFQIQLNSLTEAIYKDYFSLENIILTNQSKFIQQ
jgi:uncharacterized alpha-E superfamily protein